MSVSLFHPIIINNGKIHNSTLTSNRYEQNTTTNTNERKNIKNLMEPTEYSNHQQNDKLQQLDVVNNTKNGNNSTLFEVDRNETATTMTTETNTTVTKPAVNVMHTKITSSEVSTQHPALSYAPYTKMNGRSSSTISNQIIYKFYVPRHIGVATAHITFGHVCLHCPDVEFYIQANAFPIVGAEAENSQESNYIHSTIIKPNQTEQISIEFYVQQMTWHYALLKFVSENDSIVNTIADHARPENKPSEQAWLRRSDSFPGKKCQDAPIATESMDEEIKTNVWEKLSYMLQIDYYEQSDESPYRMPENECAETPSKNYETSNNDTKEHRKSKNAWSPRKFRGMDFYALLRQTYREFFMFDYDLVPDENGTVPAILNLTAGMAAGFAFNIGAVNDIGGTLSFAVSMKHGNKASNPEAAKSKPSIATTSDRNGILAEKLIGVPDIGSSNIKHTENNKNKTDSKNLPRSNQTIIVCMHLGEPGEPTWPDRCRYGSRFLPASSIVNNTDSNTSTGLIHVPFPESGRWYVTMGLYCHGAETASRATIIDSVKDFVRKYAYMLENMSYNCACASKFLGYRECLNDPDCLVAMNETETLKIKECLTDSKCTSNHLEMTQKFKVHHKFATEQHFALDNCSTSVVFTVSSSPCVAGRCGRYGRCYHYMSGGFVFSTCVCMKGYRGWDCTEDSQVPSTISILMASLLLTLSNLLFFPSICIAARRKFYTEAVIYFFAMFFSIFYHACDSGEDEYSFCLVKIGVLQFCDFYCGLLAIWVTLVAMSHIRQQFVSLLHMLGAILLAFGTELNKQSLWVFLAPALTGICLISATWGMRCYKSRKWFPARKYLTVYMPLGTVFVMVGLVCYAFLQTKQNYYIIHSIWHMVMALSILCLLPSSQSFMPKC